MAKLGNYHLAPGYWGRKARAIVRAWQPGARIRVSLEDKLFANGQPFKLWLVASAADAGTYPCTCVKDTAALGEAKCLTCHSSKRAPGYFRFMHETLHASSAAVAAGASGYTLTGCALDTTLKPNRIGLTAASLTGTVVTPALAYANPRSADWEVQVNAYRRLAGQTVTTSFSTDGGTTWWPIADINVVGRRPVGTGTLRFRVVMTRAAVTDESPTFEIIRARHPQPDLQTRRVVDAMPTAEPLAVGSILLAKTWVMEDVLRTAGQARLTEHQNDRSWTAPLDLFTRGIELGAVAARLSDTGDGAHHFVEQDFGITDGTRYAITQISYSEQIEGLFTYQSFTERRVQVGESLALVW